MVLICKCFILWSPIYSKYENIVMDASLSLKYFLYNKGISAKLKACLCARFFVDQCNFYHTKCAGKTCSCKTKKRSSTLIHILFSRQHALNANPFNSQTDDKLKKDVVFLLKISFYHKMAARLHGVSKQYATNCFKLH